MIASILKEYGINWILNRSLYSLKLKMLRICPQTEKFFEKTPKVKQLDIFKIDTIQLEAFLQQLPELDRGRIVDEADAAIEGKVIGFSSVLLDYGTPIDWQLNPLTNKRVDQQKKWYKIPDFDSTTGDIKVIWEISRFSHLITFARAYLLTRNVKYYKAFSEQIEQWVQENPYSYGANYKCGQECSIRMVNVLLAYTVFKELGLVTELDRQNVMKIVLGSYKKVLSNFFYAHKCIKNNHTISELMGMIIGAWCCKENKQLDKAYDYLELVICDQFTEDGGYAQYSFNYQRLALMDLDVILSISGKTHRQISEQSKKRILNSAMLLFQCQAKNYDVPNYGSNDGALIFKMTSCGYRDFRPVCNSTYQLLSGEELYEADKHREELIWLGCGSHDSFMKQSVIRQDMYCLQAGIFTLRDRRSMMMFVCNDYKKRPGHMDQMHVDLWVDDVNVLCDCGTYSYASDIGQKLLRSSSHNTATIDNKPQMSIRPPFLLYDWPKRLNVTKSDDLLQARMSFKSGYIHERTIRRKKREYIIEDSISECNDSEFCVNFHTVCDVEVEDHKIQLSYNDKIICHMYIDAEFEVVPVERSLFYMQKDMIHCISIRKNGNKKVITRIVMEEN